MNKQLTTYKMLQAVQTNPATAWITAYIPIGYDIDHRDNLECRLSPKMAKIVVPINTLKVKHG